MTKQSKTTKPELLEPEQLDAAVGGAIGAIVPCVKIAPVGIVPCVKAPKLGPHV